VFFFYVTRFSSTLAIILCNCGLRSGAGDQCQYARTLAVSGCSTLQFTFFVGVPAACVLKIPKGLFTHEPRAVKQIKVKVKHKSK
jgi:hypothetical protein